MTLNLDRKFPWIAAGLLCVGVGALIVPAYRPGLPEFVVAAESPATSTDVIKPGMTEARWAAHFDLSALPAPARPKQAEVASDPAAALKQWQLTGIILQDDQPILTVNKGSAWQIVHLSESLEGYQFVGIEGRKALFQKDGPILELSLPDISSG